LNIEIIMIKEKIMKKLIVLLLAFVMAFSMTACGKKTDDKTGTESNTPTKATTNANPTTAPNKEKLVLGTSADYPPFEFIVLDDAGKQQYAGIDISVAKKLAEDQGKELQVVNMSFDNLMASLQKGDLDIVIAAIEADDKRKEVADFSDPYYTDLPPMVLVRAEDVSKYTSMDSFKGKTVGAQTATTKAEIVTKKMKGANLLAISSVTDLVNNLVYKKCDAIVLDGAVAQQYADTNKELKISEVKLGEAAPYAIAVQKGDPKKLLDSLNKTIATITTDGSIDNYTKEANDLSDKAVKTE
jgi:polar amino acid transport system substrate-binding protein